MDLRDIENFRRQYGKRADQTLETLARYDKNLSMVMSSEIGREVLDDDLRRYSDLLFKAAQIELTIDERAEFRYLLNRIQSISNRITDYLIKLKKLQEIGD